METNIEEGVAGIGTLLNLIIVLFIITVLVAAYYSGFMQCFLNLVRSGSDCIKMGKDVIASVNCIIHLITAWLSGQCII